MRLISLDSKDAADLEICNDNTEQNESSNPSFHTDTPQPPSHLFSHHPYMLPCSTLDELVGAGNCQGMNDMQNGWDAKAG